MTDRASINTVRYRLPAIVRNLLSNVQRCHEKPVLDLGVPVWSGRTVIVVGAGPSLNRNIDQLADAQCRGAVIVAVNSALPPLAKRGIWADVAVGIESIPSERHYAHENWHRLIAQWGCAADLWDRADLWFAEAQPTWQRLARWLGISALPCGSSVSGAATALAIRMGARRVVLTGMDLAYDVDSGQSYADGATWQGWRPKLDGDSLLFEGAEDRDRHRKDSGAICVPRKQVAKRVPAWGNRGQAVTDITLLHQLQWFSWIGSRGSSALLIDATEGGARKAGWSEQRLSTALLGMGDCAAPEPPRSHFVPRPLVQGALEKLAAEGRTAERLGQRMLEGKAALDELADPMPMARALAVPDITGLNDTQGLSEFARLEATWTVWREAGRYLQQLTE